MQESDLLLGPFLTPGEGGERGHVFLHAAQIVALEALEKNPLPKHRKPAYPDYNKAGN